MRRAVLCLLLTGCVTSDARLKRLTDDTQARNDERTRTAEAELVARGTTFVDDERRFASLDEASVRRCLQALREAPSTLEADAQLARATDVARVRVARPTRAGEAPATPTELEAALGPACAFFRLRAEHLDARRLDGTPTRLVRAPDAVRLARDRSGVLFFVARSARVVARRTVLVARRCNRTPHPEVTPLEQGATLGVVVAADVPQRVDLVVEEEVLDVECTETSQ